MDKQEVLLVDGAGCRRHLVAPCEATGVLPRELTCHNVPYVQRWLLCRDPLSGRTVYALRSFSEKETIERLHEYGVLPSREGWEAPIVFPKAGAPEKASDPPKARSAEELHKFAADTFRKYGLYLSDGYFAKILLERSAGPADALTFEAWIEAKAIERSMEAVSPQKLREFLQRVTQSQGGVSRSSLWDELADDAKDMLAVLEAHDRMVKERQAAKTTPV